MLRSRLFSVLMVLGSTIAFSNGAYADQQVKYYGGPIIENVKVHAVYWGQAPSAQAQQKLKAYYEALVNSTYVDQLAEYSTDSQKIHRGTFGSLLTIQPVNTSKHLTQADVEKELEAQIASGGLPAPDANSLYMLHYPSGYSIDISFGGSCSSWDADHEVYKSAKYGNVYYAMFPCETGENADFDTLTMVASHEFAEAITDPVSPLAGQPSAAPAAWLTSDQQEIGDLCAWQTTTMTANGVTYQVQQEWLNSQNACNRATFVAN